MSFAGNSESLIS